VTPARDTFLNPLASLTFCVAAGAMFAWLKMPLPWMIGPLLLMASLNLSDARLRAPHGGRQAGQIVIGTALGLYFTPSVLQLAYQERPPGFAGVAVAV